MHVITPSSGGIYSLPIGRNRSSTTRSQRGGYGIRMYIADDLMGTSKTPNEVRKRIEKTLGNTRKWGMAADLNGCAVLPCIEGRKSR